MIDQKFLVYLGNNKFDKVWYRILLLKGVKQNTSVVLDLWVWIFLV